MTSLNHQDRAGYKRTAAGYNQTVNLFWSVISLGPLVYFCYNKMDPAWMYTFLVISVSLVLLPNSLFDRIQLNHNTSFYAKLGTRIVRRYTQDGEVINRLLKKQFPQYAPLSTTSAEKHLVKSYVNEKFHFVGLLFFLLTSLYAASGGYWWWVMSLVLINLLYNVYPILLQQYNRVRLKYLRARRAGNDTYKT